MNEIANFVSSLALLAAVAIVIVACATLCDPFVNVLKALERFLTASTDKLFTISAPQVQPEKTAEPERPKTVLPEEAKAKPEEPRPNAYCIECGTPIRRDPISSIVLPGTSYLTFECAECGEMSLKPQRSTEEVGNDAQSPT
jgi:hypothetical protein